MREYVDSSSTVLVVSPLVSLTNNQMTSPRKRGVTVCML